MSERMWWYLIPISPPPLTLDTRHFPNSTEPHVIFIATQIWELPCPHYALPDTPTLTSHLQCAITRVKVLQSTAFLFREGSADGAKHGDGDMAVPYEGEGTLGTTKPVTTHDILLESCMTKCSWGEREWEWSQFANQSSLMLEVTASKSNSPSCQKGCLLWEARVAPQV